MVKKIFLSMSIFAIFFFVSSPAKAEVIDMNEKYGETCTLRKCEVPIPTLIAPDKASFSGKNDIYLTGLTWNNTKIQVYLDTQYQGEAVVQKDDSGIGNFYYKLASNTVDKGSHKWAVIATSGYSRSFVSKENIFNVTREKEKPVLPKSEESNIVESIKEDIYILENTSSTTSSTEIIIEPVSTTTDNLDINKEVTSTSQISTSTESILSPEESAKDDLNSEVTNEPAEDKEVKPVSGGQNTVENIITKDESTVPISEDNTEKTSAIKENIDGIIISNVESAREVSVYEKNESDVSVNVAEGIERKSLVVDDNNYKPSENQTNIEKESKESSVSETLQNAKPGDVLLEKIKQELGFNSEIDKQKKNRIIGVAILSFIVALYVIVAVRRKGKK